MHLRGLQIKDAPLMIEWMHDKRIVENMKTDFSSKTISDAEDFIKNSCDSKNINLAIVDEADNYMGTVSLKGITEVYAEFAIVVRKEAMGEGYAWFAMKSILNRAFKELKLKYVYWCVSKKNQRALRFYDKHHFSRCDAVPVKLINEYKEVGDLCWYYADSEAKMLEE